MSDKIFSILNPLDMNNNSSTNILYGAAAFIVFWALVSLFYFYFLIPLHVDE